MAIQKYKDQGNNTYYLTDEEKRAEQQKYYDWESKYEQAKNDAAKKYNDLTTALRVLAILKEQVSEGFSCFDRAISQFDSLSTQLEHVSTDDITEYKQAFSNYKSIIGVATGSRADIESDIEEIYNRALNDQGVFWKRHDYLRKRFEEGIGSVTSIVHLQADLYLSQSDVEYPYNSLIFPIEANIYEDELTKGS